MSSVPSCISGLDLIECFKDFNPSTNSQEAFSQLFQKFLDGLFSWVHTLKVYSIFHAALQDQAAAVKVAAELKDKEKHLYHYAHDPNAKGFGKLL